MLESLVLGPESWVLSLRFWEPNPESQIPGSESWVPRSRVLSPEGCGARVVGLGSHVLVPYFRLCLVKYVYSLVLWIIVLKNVEKF